MEYVEWEVDLPRLVKLNKYWKKFPPIQILIASYLGYEPSEEKTAKKLEDKTEMLAELMSSLPKRELQKPVIKNGN